MPSTPLDRAEHLRRFAEELDVIARRSETEEPIPNDEVAAIFAEHEAWCAAPEAEEESAPEQVRSGRRA